MKIAVYHNLPSGGAKRALYEQICRLSKRHEIDIYVLSCADHTFCDVRPFAQTYRIFTFRPFPYFSHPFGLVNHGSRALDIYRLRREQRVIGRTIDTTRPDVVFVHSCQFTYSPAILRSVSRPTVYYCHEPLRRVCEPPITRPYTELQGWRRLVDRLNPLRLWHRVTIEREDRQNVKAANRILVNSHFSRESVYRTYGVWPHTCYLGVDSTFFRPLGLPRQHKVLSVGQLSPHKGFDFVIRSLAHIPVDQRPSFQIVANSETPGERAYLERLAEAHVVTLDIQTRVSDRDLLNLYNRAALVAYAPVLEPFGLVTLEAAACGTPVVGVHEGGIRETVVHRETGLLTERDSQEFAEAMRRLLIDSTLSARYGRQARERAVEKWNWEQSVATLETYLHQAAGK